MKGYFFCEQFKKYLNCISREPSAIHPKIFRNCPPTENLHSKKSEEIPALYAVEATFAIIYLQASAYEACDRTRTPLHTPKTLETCKKKSTPCLIRKASRSAADRTSKTTTCFIYFIGSVVKVVLYLHFLYTKDGRLHQVKTKHEWWKNLFSDAFTYRLNLKSFAPFLLDTG